MKLIKILILVITILFTFSCEDKDKEITDIKLNDYEHKQDVDDFSISDILLIIEYDDNSFNQICITKDMIDENDLSKLNNLGKHNIKVNYKNFDIYLDIELTDYYKVDFIVDNEKGPMVIEVNTSPGMTELSLFPDSARHAGISFEELVLKIIELGLK